MSTSDNTPDNRGLEKLSEIMALLEKVAMVETDLADNEREIYNELRQKYAKSCEIGFDDKILLEVMLRNITVRHGQNML